MSFIPLTFFCSTRVALRKALILSPTLHGMGQNQ